MKKASGLVYKTSWQLLLLLLMNLTAFSQGRTVSGRVTDSTHTPLSNVSVRVKGTNTGTTTNAGGNFSLSVPSTASVLVFSYTGMQNEEVTIGEQTTLNVVLRTASGSLSEVVVIGYGTARKSDLTGSVATVKSDKLMDKPVTNVSQALQGKVPGVDVSINTSAPGEPAKVRIRGISSINSSLDPIYVVDGVIGVNANILDPNDIASLEVLKDASATAIYGARGANGVIIITTKRGIRNKNRISYDSYVSYTDLQRHLKALNSDEFMYVYNLAYANTQKYDSMGYAEGKYIPNNPKDFPNLFDANGKPLYNTNWEKEVYKPSFSTGHHIALQGGNDKMLYSLSFGYQDQNGIMIQSWFRRYSTRFTIDNDVNKWLTIGGSVSLIKSKERLVSDANGGLNVSRMVIEELPIIPVKYPDGTWGGNGDFPGMEGGSNPVDIANNRYTIQNILQSVGDVYATFHLAPGLDFKSDFGYSVSAQKNNFYSGRGLRSLSFDQKGVATISNWNNSYWQTENYLTYNKRIARNHRLTALLGLSWQKNYYEYSYSQAENFIDDYWGWHNLGAGSIYGTPASNDGQWAMNSYFARFTYNISEKYLFTLTGRYDGSSKFGENKKYAFFPSAGVGWKLSEEDFLKNNKVIRYLKLRASVGSTGNQEIGTYNSIQLLGSGTTIFNNERQPTIFRSSFGNSNLKWERINQWDIGIELAVFNNRITLNADYYQRTTKDLLLAAPIPWTSGLETVTQNIGSLVNKGFEFALTTQNIKSRGFTWTTDVNFSANRNKILHLGEKNDDIFPGPWFLGETNILRVGWPIGTFWGYIREGTWSTKEAAEAAKYDRLPGDIKWADLNKDGVIDDADNTRLGQAYPKWTGDIVNTFTYKNFDFSFDIRFVQGVSTVANFKHSVEDRQGIANSLKTVLGAWTPENQNSNIAEIRYYGSKYYTHIDSWWVEDGSFIRGQNFVLGYTIPQKLVDRWGMERLRFYASAQNLFLITDYTGYDPEVLTFGGQLTQNQDFFPYPRPRVINVGVNLTF